MQTWAQPLLTDSNALKSSKLLSVPYHIREVYSKLLLSEVMSHYCQQYQQLEFLLY